MEAHRLRAGGDWNFTINLALGHGRRHLGIEELLDDGAYHGTIRSYDADRGRFVAALSFDGGSGQPGSFVNGLAAKGRSVVSGGEIATEDGFDFVVRSDLDPGRL